VLGIALGASTAVPAAASADRAERQEEADTG